MRKIDKPLFKVRDVILSSISKTIDNKSSKKIESAIDFIEICETEYEEKKKNNELFLLSQHKIVDGILNGNALKNLYGNRMLVKDNEARDYYERILSSAPDGRCPLCTLKPASTLDHYLPKSLYPIYSVTPINLIPACRDCNTDKLISYPRNSEEETLHPYFDDIENEIWLKMKVVKINPLLFEYYVDPPKYWSDCLKMRTEKHLLSFNLNELFCSHAQEEFGNIASQLKLLYKMGGDVGLKAFLFDCYKSRFNNNMNSWQTAFYSGLYDSDCFINQYFK